MLASHALALVGVPMRRVIRVVQDQRDARYNLLRGYFHGADDDASDEQDNIRLSSVTLSHTDHAVSLLLADVAASLKNVQVISLKRKNGQQLTLEESEKTNDLTLSLADGDTLVLSGKPESLDLAEKKLVNG
jgi:monovalent cation:H+ antiporter-2, CPA2 family